MARAVQKRTIETRARLVVVAEALVGESGFEALRVEDVVREAGVAKGTFFAHFRDKDALMDLLVGQRIDAELDRIEGLAPPRDIAGLVAALAPLIEVMTCERCVFDLILRHSGAAALAEIGPIAMTLMRSGEVLGAWLAEGPFRKDVTPYLLAEGVQAFLVQAIGLHFCALHQDRTIADRLAEYLRAWLLPV